MNIIYPFLMSNLVNPFEPLDSFLKQTIKDNVHTILAGSNYYYSQSLPLLYPQKLHKADVIARQDCLFCGAPWVDEILAQTDPAIFVDWHVVEGAFILADQPVCTIQADVKYLLDIQHYILLFLNFLSKIATEVRKYLTIIKQKGIKLSLGQPKIPMFLHAYQYAVMVGQAELSLILQSNKQTLTMNEVKAMGGMQSIASYINSQFSDNNVSLEVESLSELKECLNANIPFITFKTNRLNDVQEASILVQNKAFLEVTGPIICHHFQKIIDLKISSIQVDLTSSFEDLDYFQFSLL